MEDNEGNKTKKRPFFSMKKMMRKKAPDSSASASESPASRSHGSNFLGLFWGKGKHPHGNLEPSKSVPANISVRNNSALTSALHSISYSTLPAASFLEHPPVSNIISKHGEVATVPASRADISGMSTRALVPGTLEPVGSSISKPTVGPFEASFPPISASVVDSSTQMQVPQQTKRLFNWTDGFYSIDRILEMGKSLGEAAGIVSAPLMAACGVTQTFVKTAQEVLENREETKELINKLSHHLTFLEQEERKVRSSLLGSADITELGLYESLQAYALDLREVGMELEQLQRRGENGPKKFVKEVLTVKSTQDTLKECLCKLEDGFQRFMVSVNALTTANTRELLARDTLNKLSIAKPKMHHDTCLSGTRTKILEDIRQWANDPNAGPIFALVDQAGTGKSTIANTMIQVWLSEGRLGARFYFTKPSVVSATDLASSLSRSIADKVPRIRRHIVAAVSKNSDFVNDAVAIQLENLLFTPLREGMAEISKALDAIKEEKSRKDGLESSDRRPRYPTNDAKVHEAERLYLEALGKVRMGQRNEGEVKALEEAYMRYLESMEASLLNALTYPPVIAIDALDECSERERHIVLRSLLRSISTCHSCKLLLTCRPESDIHEDLQAHKDVICQPAYSLLSDANDPNHDISIYTNVHLGNILNPSQISRFIERANGLFIWAATAAEFLTSSRGLVKNRFNMLLTSSPQESPLMSLYREILTSTAHQFFDEHDTLKKILQAIAVACEPLPVQIIEELLGITQEDDGVVETMVSALRSVLSSSAEGGGVYALHSTFIEYLRSGSLPENLGFSVEDAHALLANGCFRTLKSQLRYNICDMVKPNASTLLNSDVLDLKKPIQANITPTLHYAAIHTFSHVASCLLNESIISQMRSFFQEQLLYWIEFMSMLGKIYPLVQAIYTLKGSIQKKMLGAERGLNKGRRNRRMQSLPVLDEQDVQWCSETLRMVQLFQRAIEDDAMQIYRSALSFAPQEGLIYKAYHGIYEKKIPKVLRGSSSLDTRSTVLVGHSSAVCSLAFSPDSRRIASGSDDRTMRVWDPESGAAVGGPLKGHDFPVTSISFLDNEKRIVSGSLEGTVRLWDMKSGTSVGEPLECHTQGVRCIAFSPDGKSSCLGLSDATVRLWDWENSTAIGEPLEGHTRAIRCLAFSPDGRKIASGSSDTTIRLWDRKNGTAVGRPLQSHTGPINLIAFSPDGRRIASASDDRTMRLWDVETGHIIGGPLKGYTEGVTCLSFSPDGYMIAFGLSDGTVRLWDERVGAEVGAPLRGHTRGVKCVVFSPDSKFIASGSDDQTVRLWDGKAGARVDGRLEIHTLRVTCLSFSPDGRRIVTGSDDCTMRLWDGTTGAEIGKPLEGHTGAVTCLSFSPNGKRIASGSDDFTIRLWDGETGMSIGSSLQGHRFAVTCLSFSHDGKRIASGSNDRTIRLWDQESGAEIGKPLGDHDVGVNCLLFSPDDRVIASGSWSGAAYLWDTQNFAAVGQPRAHTIRVTCLSFSPDGRRMASGSEDCTVFLWDVENGATVEEAIRVGEAVHTCEFHIKDDILLLKVNDSIVYNASSQQRVIMPSILSSNLLLHDRERNLTSIQCALGHLRFYLPSDFPIRIWSIHEKRIAYGADNGSIIIVDCSHL